MNSYCSGLRKIKHSSKGGNDLERRFQSAIWNSTGACVKSSGSILLPLLRHAISKLNSQNHNRRSKLLETKMFMHASHIGPFSKIDQGYLIGLIRSHDELINRKAHSLSQVASKNVTEVTCRKTCHLFTCKLNVWDLVVEFRNS
jgi:hypothetical protein